MNTIKKIKLAAAITAGMTLIGCGSSSDDDTSTDIAKVFECTDDATQGARVICIGSADDLSDSAVQTELLTALLTSQTGDTFIFPQGRFNMTTTIGFQGINEDSEVVSNLTFKGAGMDKTIFDVSGSTADGFKIEDTNNLTFEDFGVYESNNNAIKVSGSDGIIMRRIATVWETDYQATNGAYGLYPVQSSNILIEDSFVQGSADAGVYVGQSDHIVVRNNTAVKNVAGIEIENSTEADVYGNTARGNTAGILVFDLPIGNGKYGSGVRVFDNIVDANNAPNFAAGCTDEQIEEETCFEGGVHIAPPGSGMIVLSTSDVEIFNNTITDHQTFAIAATSYLMADLQVASSPNSDVGGAQNSAVYYNEDGTPKAEFQETITINGKEKTDWIAGSDAEAEVKDDVFSYGQISKFADKYLDGWSPFVNGLNIHDNTISVADGVNAPEGSLIQSIIDGYKQLQTTLGMISADDNAKIPSILYDGIGELLTITPYVVEGNPTGMNLMQAIAGGTDQVAAALRDNGFLGSDPEFKVIGDFTNPENPTYNNFDGSLYQVDATSVCQSNNGVDGITITAASVFHTEPEHIAASFNGDEPLSKVEIAEAKAELKDIEGVIAEATAMLSDNSMTCAEAAYIGEPAVVTIGNDSYGCGDDDTSSTFCTPQ